MKKDDMKFYIGIDSGGTKCEVLIADSQKKIISKKKFKGVHYSISGGKVYGKAVSEFIKILLKRSKLDLKNCLGIGIGVAGAREKSDREQLKKIFQNELKFKKVVVTTDAMTALYGAFGGGEGIILISGTGSVLYGFSDDKITRIGGWGRIIGDEGSGYWIGKRALNLVMKEYDFKKSKQSLLMKKLKERFGITRETVHKKIFAGNFEIQKIAPLVIELAAKHCRLSIQIVNEAVSDLTEQIRKFIEVSGRKKNINLAFIGSIIENKNILSDNLKKEIKKLKIVKVIPKKNSPVFGAVYITSENSNITGKL